jgi:hypothetical protein
MARFATLALIALLCLGGCGGGGFVPDAGPYVGTFTANGQDIGQLTLTFTGGLLGGTGTLIHNDQSVTVTISALMQEKQIGGTINNASLGNGEFDGQFTSVVAAQGTFVYTDAGDISTTTGTWRVESD